MDLWWDGYYISSLFMNIKTYVIVILLEHDRSAYIIVIVVIRIQIYVTIHKIYAKYFMHTR